MTTITSSDSDRIATLQAALHSPDAAVRFNAGLDLVKLGDVAGIPPLIEAFQHESAAVRLFHAGQALVQLGAPAVPMLTTALKSDNPLVRIDAAFVLYQIEPARFAALLPILSEALGATDQKVLGDALQFLSKVTDPAVRQVVPQLIATLQTTTLAEDPEGWWTDPRTTVAVLLAKIGEPVDEVVAALATALTSPIAAVRWGAACALAEMGPAARRALPSLRQVIEDEAEIEMVRVEAAYALAMIGDPANETMPALLTMLDSADWWLRVFGVRILGELASSAERPKVELFDVVDRALMGMRGLPCLTTPPATLATALTQLLDDPNYNVRRNAVAALAKLERQAINAVPKLLTLLAQADLGPVAAEALAQIGEPALPALLDSLTGAQAAYLRHAAYALTLYNTPAATAALTQLVETQGLEPLQPTTGHFYCQVQVTLDLAKCAAFEALYQTTLANGRGSEVDYTLPYPKHEFLHYLVEQKGLFLHGSGKADIDVLKPFRYGRDAAEHGNVSGVYADKDPIRPVYFAVVNGRRSFGLNNGYFNLTADGESSSKGDLPCNERFYKLAIGVNGLRRPFWRTGMLYILPPDTFTYNEEWTSRAPVPPLMRLQVTADDLPLRDHVWGSDWRRLDLNWVRPSDPFPFLKDVQMHPILPAERPAWLR